MADIINLKRARKRKNREDKALQAAENRVRHGRTKAQKHADEAASAEAEHRLDLLKLERATDSDETS